MRKFNFDDNYEVPREDWIEFFDNLSLIQNAE